MYFYHNCDYPTVHKIVFDRILLL